MQVQDSLSTAMTLQATEQLSTGNYREDAVIISDRIRFKACKVYICSSLSVCKTVQTMTASSN